MANDRKVAPFLDVGDKPRPEPRLPTKGPPYRVGETYEFAPVPDPYRRPARLPTNGAGRVGEPAKYPPVPGFGDDDGDDER